MGERFHPRVGSRAGRLGVALACAALAACASTAGPGPEAGGEDPLEDLNRPVFSFNDGLDRHLLAPVARGWSALAPRPVRVGLSRFFANLRTPGYFLNDLLQGDVKQSGVELSRFLVNSTVGLAGFFDPAAGALDLRGRDEDFGQTLGVWGVPPGPYFMLPGAGSYAARELAALPVDLVLDPAIVVPGLNLVYGVNRRSLSLEEVDDAREAALDLYVFVRDGYRQSRRAAVRNGEEPPERAPDDDFYELEESD